MTTLALTWAPVSIGISRSPASSEAQCVEHSASRALQQIAAPQGFDDLATLNADLLEKGAALNEATLRIAERFLLALPGSLPAPELSVDPDGEVVFDWFGPNNKSFSISLNFRGRVTYAGRTSAQRTPYGTDYFDDMVSEDLVRDIRAAVASA